MTELESIQPKKDKRPAKPSAKKTLVKAVGVGAATAATVVAVRRVLRKKPVGKSEIIIPEGLPRPSGKDITAPARRKLAMVMADSLSPRQVAEMLSTSAPAIVRRIRARSLYAIPFEGTWLLPTFQFRDGALLRGMEKILPRLDSALHPLEVINWFSLRNPDLVMRGAAVSPATWLERGGDVESVAALAAEAGSGL